MGSGLEVVCLVLDYAFGTECDVAILAVKFNPLWRMRLAQVLLFHSGCRHFEIPSQTACYNRLWYEFMVLHSDFSSCHIVILSGGILWGLSLFRYLNHWLSCWSIGWLSNGYLLLLWTCCCHLTSESNVSGQVILSFDVSTQRGLREQGKCGCGKGICINAWP